MNQAMNLTLSNKEVWEKSLYYKFLKNSNKLEFLNSQIPFYRAVEAFPRMLLKLAALIETSEERFLVIENIWEEHGNGENKLYHTKTFNNHLKALGYQEKDFYKNPFVEEWINTILNSKLNISQLGSLIGGIEYIYAVISEDIANKIETFNLNKESTHYAKHSELDWSHGQELLDVVVKCKQDVNYELFEKAQIDFINLFNLLASPTEKELQKVSKEPVSFFYSREDSNIGLKAISKLNRKNLNIFSICSGGEHILEYIDTFDNLNIDIFDLNKNQIDVFKNKLNGNKQKDFGKFEYFFYYLRKQLNCNNIITHSDIIDNYSKLVFLTKNIFSRKNLNIVFTEEATKYSKNDFDMHFYEAFIRSIIKNNRNAINIFQNIPLLKTFKHNLKNNTLNYIVSDLINYDFNKKYDVIDISNVGDWMNIEDFRKIIDNAYNSLNKDGILISRKLLGDYQLSKELLKFNNIENIQDETFFYSETCIVTKL
jgi:hypothetical protein